MPQGMFFCFFFFYIRPEFSILNIVLPVSPAEPVVYG
jgi:hypothetical protein